MTLSLVNFPFRARRLSSPVSASRGRLPMAIAAAMASSGTLPVYADTDTTNVLPLISIEAQAPMARVWAVTVFRPSFVPRAVSA